MISFAIFHIQLMANNKEYCRQVKTKTNNSLINKILIIHEK